MVKKCEVGNLCKKKLYSIKKRKRGENYRIDGFYKKMIEIFKMTIKKRIFKSVFFMS